MKVLRISPKTGKVNTMEFPASVTAERISAYEQSRVAGNAPYIQRAFPELTADQREFLKTGFTPEDWNEIFSGSENTARPE
jgi:hypothetical protein